MVEPLGIVGGSGFLGGPLLSGLAKERVVTERGEVPVYRGEGFVLLLRHGHGGVYRPPHRIPHHAHVLAFEALGVRRVAGLSSVGSLDPDLLPGTAVIPDDYFSVHPPPTFCEDERLHIVPRLDPDLRALLVTAARSTPGPVRDGGVYVETRGPRFETPAEVRWLAGLGDVVGMTAATEATLFQEREIGYATLGVVDNLANGLGPAPLTFEAYETRRRGNEERTREILRALVRLEKEDGE